MAFQRKRFNRQQLVQKAKENATTGRTVHFLNVPHKKYAFHIKKNLLSIIPFTVTQKNIDGIDPGDLWYKAQVFVHPNIGVNKISVLCPAKMLNRRCPICEADRQLESEGIDWNDQERMLLRAKKREIYNVIDMDKPEDGVQILEASYHVFGKKLDAEVEDDEENGVFPDPDEGMLVVARGVESTFNGRKFIDIDKVNFEPRDPLTDEQLEAAVDLHAALKFYSYDELVDLMNGGALDSENTAQDASRATKTENVNKDSDEEENAPEHGSEDATEEVESKQVRTKPSKPAEEESDPEVACKYYGKECGYDDEVCDECEHWRICRKKTDAYLKAKRSR